MPASLPASSGSPAGQRAPCPVGKATLSPAASRAQPAPATTASSRRSAPGGTRRCPRSMT